MSNDDNPGDGNDERLLNPKKRTALRYGQREMDVLPHILSEDGRYHEYLTLWHSDDERCPECGYDRMHVTTDTLAGVAKLSCNNPACDHWEEA